MGTPLANPVYLSDSPRFLQRQRLRAARAAVSEHVPSLTCPCQKCRQAAQTRAVAGYGIATPSVGPTGREAWNSASGSDHLAIQREGTLLPLGFDEGGRACSSSAPSPGAPAALPSPKHTLRTGAAAPDAPLRSSVERPVYATYAWLLNAVWECFASDSATADMEPVRKQFGNKGPPAKTDCLAGKLGCKIPDIVILRNGKPRKRFSLDSRGRMQMEIMDSSAQLLRVLRKYVQLAQKNRPIAPALNLAPKRNRSPAQRSSIIAGGKVIATSRSEPLLACNRPDSRGDAAAAPGPYIAGSATAARLNSQGKRGAEPLREAAVLYYSDGAVRYMTSGEAMKQMENVSRLPKEFWMNIVMLQTPVTPKPESTTRYITYSYDVHSEGFEPQAPLPRVHRRANSIPNADKRHSQDGALVASVARKINAALSTKKGGRYGNGAGIISGRFEFVLDESDGTLWLINADKLVIEEKRAQVEDSNSEEDEQIRYFEEHVFGELMQEQEKNYDTMKQRWELQEQPGLTSLGGGDEQFVLVSRNAADRLDGKKSPGELLKYYQAESKMLRYYTELKSETDGKDYARKLDRALGLCIWFKRWQKIHRGPRAQLAASTAKEKETW